MLKNIKPYGSRGIREDFNEYYSYYIGDNDFVRKIHYGIDIFCGYFKYGIWINNYFEYKFWEKSAEYRNEFLTWKRAVRFINSVNGKGHNPIFRKKSLFLKEFNEFIRRDWIYASEANEEQVCNFLKRHKVVITKCNEGMYGKGVEKIHTDSISDLHQFYIDCKNDNILIEECITECDEIQELHVDSLNTIRVATLLKEDSEVEILGSVLRMGNNGASVDNARADGLFAAIDIENGIVISKAINFMNEEHVVHPYSKKRITGIEIPVWDEVCSTCVNAAKKHTETRLVGWDVVVRQIDSRYVVELIEGNDRPGVPTLQAPLQKGIYRRVKAYV